jgi:SAM-dependent methyltransferase
MRKGWFKLPDQDGDRTVEEQMVGLETIDWRGRRVVDFGCAEGAISAVAHESGAERVLGLDVVAEHIVRAKSMGLPNAAFGRINLDAYTLPDDYDIALMLAVLHKLCNPTDFLERNLPRINTLCVVRLPPTGPVIIDDRSGRRPHDILVPFHNDGWELMRAARGSRDEWMGYFVRVLR